MHVIQFLVSWKGKKRRKEQDDIKFNFDTLKFTFFQKDIKNVG